MIVSAGAVGSPKLLMRRSASARATTCSSWASRCGRICRWAKTHDHLHMSDQRQHPRADQPCSAPIAACRR
ncbi:hypothetical protein M8494_25585 [Serratia ureilytica]